MSRPKDGRASSDTKTGRAGTPAVTIDKVAADYIDALKRMGANERVIEAARTQAYRTARKGR